MARTSDRRSSAAGKTWVGVAAILIADGLVGAAVIQETNIDLSVDPNGQAMSVRTRLHVADNTGDQQLVCHFLKGALAIHALQTQMGDERFFPGFKMLFLQSGDEPVTLAYYQQCFESAYGGSLATFFHRWYYEPGLPSITPPTAPTRR